MGLPQCGKEVNADSPPNSYDYVVSCKDHKPLEEAMMNEYRGFQDMKALAVVKPPKGARLHDTSPRREYKEENGKLVT